MKKFGCAKLQNVGKQTFVAQDSIALSGSKALSLGLLLFFSIIKILIWHTAKTFSDFQTCLISFNLSGVAKVQIISKWFFGFIAFLQKTNEQIRLTTMTTCFRSFFGGNRRPLKTFRD